MDTKDIKIGGRTLTRFSAPHGVVLYRGIAILCDGPDERVVVLIDSLPLEERTNLVAVEQHEGEVRFAWRYSVPERFALERSVDCCGDNWVVDGAFEVSAPA